MELHASHDLSLDTLTPAQRQAVMHIEGPLMVLAGPGSGKTRVVTYRIAHMLQQGISPHNILALTFTNKAATEMRSRLNQLVPNSHVFAATFHRFCAQILRQYAGLAGLNQSFTIFDTADSRRLMKNVVEENKIEINHFSINDLLKEISSAKQNLVYYKDFRPRQWMPIDALVAKVYPLFQEGLLASNAVDFDDLLFHVAKLLTDNETIRATLDEQFKYVSVDEYQDTNSAQYRIVRALSSDHPNLAVTGDPDQSIYGWRGANLNNILNFESHYPGVEIVKLEQNYRSTKSILSVADKLISYNVKRKQKLLFTENDDGEPVRLVIFPTQKDEAQQIAEQISVALSNGKNARDYAIFYRINALSRSIEHALRSAGVPYQIVNGHEFYQRKEVKDLIAYLQVLVNPQNEVALERIINVPTRKIGKVTLGRVRKFARLNGISMLDAVRNSEQNEELTKAARGNLFKFIEVYDRMVAVVDEPVEAVLGHLMTASKYREMFDVTINPEDGDRIANVDELLNATREYDDDNPDGSVEGFLEQASLVSDIDAWEGTDDRVTLMTFHAAKGLEFPYVFMIAIEEGVLPHSRSNDDPDSLEEERRLMFVGITRAEKELQMSYATKRLRQGSMMMTCPSRFLMELPRSEMEIIEPPKRSRFGYSENDDNDDFHVDEEYDEFPSIQINADTKMSATKPTAKVITAAEMLAMAADTPTERTPVHLYQLNTLVSHPDYGTGKVIALSGTEKKRTATVDFFNHRQEKFRLAYCDLKIVKENL